MTRLELSEWLVQHGKSADAAGMLAEARATFAALGAAPWIERADGAAGSPSASKEQTALPA
ncbi:MAG: hypothetical protein WB808_05260 [Candidatus Dormiibacterota bacterium]